MEHECPHELIRDFEAAQTELAEYRYELVLHDIMGRISNPLSAQIYNIAGLCVDAEEDLQIAREALLETLLEQEQEFGAR